VFILVELRHSLGKNIVHELIKKYKNFIELELKCYSLAFAYERVEGRYFYIPLIC